jgi:hypothetical protein
MSERDHYSNKGGHKERSEHWRAVDKIAKLLGRDFNYSPSDRTPKDVAHIIRRSMNRNPRSGK